jgi:hypothetical protein
VCACSSVPTSRTQKMREGEYFSYSSTLSIIVISEMPGESCCSATGRKKKMTIEAGEGG